MKKNIQWCHIYLAVVLVIIYVPIVAVVVYSFHSSKLAVGWSGFTLDWYKKLWNNHGIMEAVRNSLILGVVSSLLAAAIGMAAAVAMAGRHSGSQKFMENLAMMPILIPEIILGMIFLSYFSLLHLPMGMVTLVIAHTAFCIPYIYMLVKSRLAGMDPSMVEAARDLGADGTRAFWDITLPYLMPAVLSGSLLAFAMSWDDVVISIFVNGPRLNTLPIKIYTQIKTGVTPEINALCTVILIITIGIMIVANAVRRRGQATLQKSQQQ